MMVVVEWRGMERLIVGRNMCNDLESRWEKEDRQR